jgi:hypothetical protein
MKNANDSALLRATVATTSSETQGVISDITGDETLQEETVVLILVVERKELQKKRRKKLHRIIRK